MTSTEEPLSTLQLNHFLDLPVEIIAKIWVLLAPGSKRSFLGSNKELRSQLLSCVTHLRVSGFTPTPESVAPLLAGYPGLRFLEVSIHTAALGQLMDCPKPMRQGTPLLTCASSLEKFTITAQPNNGSARPSTALDAATLNAFSACFSHLVYLKIINFPAVNGTALAPLSSCKQLRALELCTGEGGTGISKEALASLPLLSSVQNLVLARLSKADHTVALAAKVPNLTSLSVSTNGYFWNVEGMIPMLSGLSCLQDLSLLNTDSYGFYGSLNSLVACFSDAHLTRLVAPQAVLTLDESNRKGTLRNLRQLTLCSVAHTSSATDAVESFRGAFSHVTSLTIALPCSCNDDSLRLAVSVCSSLQRLVMNASLQRSAGLSDLLHATAPVPEVLLKIQGPPVSAPVLQQLSEMPNLQGAWLAVHGDGTIPTLQEYMQHVQHLKLLCCNGQMTSEQLLGLCNRLPQLETLSLGWIKSATNRATCEKLVAGLVQLCAAPGAVHRVRLLVISVDRRCLPEELLLELNEKLQEAGCSMLIFSYEDTFADAGLL